LQDHCGEGAAGLGNRVLTANAAAPLREQFAKDGGAVAALSDAIVATPWVADRPYGHPSESRAS
jgi:hypothetical protein